MHAQKVVLPSLLSLTLKIVIADLDNLLKSYAQRKVHNSFK